MAGYDTVRLVHRLEEEVAELGLQMCYSQLRYGSEYGDIVCLKPTEAGVPIYSRDADLFNGTLAELDFWLRGIKWARNYDTMLKVSDDKKRERKEQDERNRQLLNLIKHSDEKENIL